MTEPAAAAGPPQCKWDLYADGHRCTRAPDPRHGSRGPRLRDYCYRADGPGQPVHNPLNAWQARRRLAAAAEAKPAVGGAGASPAQVTMTQAQVTGAELVQSLHAEVGRIGEIHIRLLEAVAAATDPAAAEAEIKAVRAEARGAIEAAGQRADAAERLAEEADAAAEQMGEELAAAEQRAADAVRAATALLRASAVAWRTAYRQATRARAEAEEAIGHARTEMGLAIEQARAQAAELVRTAQGERAEAVQAAARAGEEARLAQQERAGADAAATSARDELARFRDDTEKLLAQMRADAGRERDQLRAAWESRAGRDADEIGRLRAELDLARTAAGKKTASAGAGPPAKGGARSRPSRPAGGAGRDRA